MALRVNIIITSLSFASLVKMIITLGGVRMPVADLMKRFGGRRCHGSDPPPGRSIPAADLRKRRILIVGTPNVGKSVIFNYLTRAYVTVSNYPGTTVEVARGKGKFGGQEYEVIDTPGLYSLVPITEEERVSRDLLLGEKVEIVLHVVDAKNLERMLGLTLQLLEAGLPVILVVNIMDEAERLGLHFDLKLLEERLGIPVVGTVSTTGKGLSLLRRVIAAYVDGDRPGSHLQVDYGDAVERAAARVEGLLSGEYPISRRGLALVLLQGDEKLLKQVGRREGAHKARAVSRAVREELKAWEEEEDAPLEYRVMLRRKEMVENLLKGVISFHRTRRVNLSDWLSDLTMNPVTGVPILVLVLYFGLYQLVGVFGAGTLVDYLETEIFEAQINPVVNRLVTTYIPYQPIQELLALEYGIVTLGIRYAVAIVLPVVGTFFLVFSIIEDSGYLPRLAMLVDILFKRIGLNGRAVIPMTLGFGCDTMATMVSRTLETPRERVIATLLLALAIPCSAQLGVILALLSGNGAALLIWTGFILFVFLFIGYLSAQILPGERPSFYMEVPPLRLPRLGNVITKTYTRMHWYLLEVLPLFVLASVLIWVGRMTGLFETVIRVLEPVVRWIGLPPEAARVFLFGFFRRDYGAAGLYDLHQSGGLNPIQLVVAAATLTLFVPCVAQFTMMVKERGWKTTLAITLFIFPFAFLVGFLINTLLTGIGAGLWLGG